MLAGDARASNESLKLGYYLPVGRPERPPILEAVESAGPVHISTLGLCQYLGRMQASQLKNRSASVVPTASTCSQLHHKHVEHNGPWPLLLQKQVACLDSYLHQLSPAHIGSWSMSRHSSLLMTSISGVRRPGAIDTVSI